MMSREELKQLLEQAKELGVESVEIEGIKYTLRRDPVMRQDYVPEVAPEEILKPLSAFDELSEEEVLYYATPYYDELQARKQEKQEKKRLSDELKRAI